MAEVTEPADLVKLLGHLGDESGCTRLQEKGSLPEKVR